jgi:hypothetical protein
MRRVGGMGTEKASNYKFAGFFYILDSLGVKSGGGVVSILIL